MAEPFQPMTDPTGQVSLAPQVPAAAAEMVPPAPVISAPGPGLAPVPTLPTPPLPPPPFLHAPGPVDPKQQLMALAAIGALLGAGPRSGVGAGIGQGTANLLQALQQRRDAQYGWQLQEQDRIRKEMEAQQRAATTVREAQDRDFRTFVERRKAEVKAITDPERYQDFTQASVDMANLMGRRISAQEMTQLVPYMPPLHEQRYVDAWEQWKKNPVNVNMLEQDPARVLGGSIPVNMGTRAKPDIRPMALPQVAELAGEGFARGPDGQYIIVPKQAANSSEFTTKLNSLTDVFKSTYRREPNATEKDALVTAAIEATKVKPPGPEKLIKVEHRDIETGKDVVEWLPESQVRGRQFAPREGQTVESRLVSAKAVVQTGNDMIAALKDPAIARILGPVMGRYSSAADFFGNPPPEFSRLAGQVESYSLANMGVHGMRANTGAEAIKYTLGVGRHTPASIIATIEGLNAFAKHLLENEGVKSDSGTAPLPRRRVLSTDPNAGQPLRTR